MIPKPNFLLLLVLLSSVFTARVIVSRKQAIDWAAFGDSTTATSPTDRTVDWKSESLLDDLEESRMKNEIGEQLPKTKNELEVVLNALDMEQLKGSKTKLNDDNVAKQKHMIFKCKSGSICRMDVSDQLQISKNATVFIHSLDDAEVWMDSQHGRDFIGVPISEGKFHYLIAFHEPNGRIHEVPIEIDVEDYPSPNHLFKLVISDPAVEIFDNFPHYRTIFIETLAEALNSDMDLIALDEIYEVRDYTIISFFNNSLSTSTCDSKAIIKVAEKMYYTNGRKPSARFLTKMGEDFVVKNAMFSAIGQCKGVFSSPRPTTRTSNTTTAAMTTLKPSLKKGSSTTGTILSLGTICAIVVILHYGCKKEVKEEKTPDNEPLIPSEQTLGHMQEINLNDEEENSV